MKLRAPLLLAALLAAWPLAGQAQSYPQAVEAYRSHDYAAALPAFQRLAQQGHAGAQHALGQMYRHGLGVRQDDAQATEWFLKAARQGVGQAQVNMGAAYLEGRGVPRDERQAAEWYRKAAEQGRPAGQLGLSRLYEAGRGGLPKDPQKAYLWASLAAAQGNARGDEARARLTATLTPAQRAQVASMVKEWKPKVAPQAPGAMEEGGPAATPGTGPQASGHRPSSTGSGFRVARDAVVTNNHVIDRCARVRVNGADAKVAGQDARSDLAVLTTTSVGSAVKLRAEAAAIGEVVAVAGYPLRGLLSGFNMTTGNVSSLSGLRGDARYIQITAPVQRGNSGGPMLDASGNLMGVVVSKLDAMKLARSTGDIPQNVNFAIQANVLRSFLDANGVRYASERSTQVMPATAIAEKARDFTVLVECWKP